MKIKTAEIGEHLDGLDYPLERAAAADRCSDVTVQLAEGEENLGDLVAGATRDSYDSSEELLVDVQNQLPRNAVGEPFQSEGEG
jgi:hypothetical protein